MKKTAIIILLLNQCQPCPAGVTADCLFFECRGEPKAGQLAVASVILNRAQKSGKSLEAVCLAPKQFSCFNRGYTKANPRTGQEMAILAYFEALESQMKAGTFRPTTKATSYLRFDCFPAWRKSLRNQERIGNHIFGECD